MRSLLPIISLSMCLTCLCSGAWAQSDPSGDTSKSEAEAKTEKPTKASKTSADASADRKANEDGVEGQKSTTDVAKGTQPPPNKTAASTPTKKAKVVPPAQALSAPRLVAKTPKSVGPKSRERNRRKHHRYFPTSSGAIGIDRTMTAEVGVVDTFRLRAGIGGFSASDFPVDGATNDFIETALSIGYTPDEFWEVFFAVGGTSNTNSLGRPQLIQTQGDVSVGGKFVAEISPQVSAGGALNLNLLSDVGSGGFAWGATSVELRGLLSMDLKKTENEPLRFNVNIGYLIENSEKLDNGLSSEPTLIQEFGLQTARYDRLTLGLGLEVPLDEPIVPFAEYEIALPILVELGRRAEDSNDYGFFSIPHSLALGLRAYPTEDLAVETSVRFGLSDQPYTGVPATPPWLLSFAIAYHLDPVPVVVETVVEKVIEAPAPPVVVPPPAPKLRTFTARVEDANTSLPVKQVIVVYEGLPLTPQAAGSQGQFQSYALEDGEVRLKLKAEGYESSDQTVVVGPDLVKEQVFTLKPLPNDKPATLTINVRDERDRKTAAAVEFGRKNEALTGTTDKQGTYSKALKAGTYAFTVTKRGYEPASRSTTLQAGVAKVFNISLEKRKPTPVVKAEAPKPKPKAPAASSGSKYRKWSMIPLGGRVSFASGSASLTGQGQRALRRAVRVLTQNKSILKVLIGVHTDGRGPMAAQKRLSLARAKSIKSFLVSNGVDRKRLSVKGYGGSQLRAPPITKRGRMMNERVGLIVLKVN